MESLYDIILTTFQTSCNELGILFTQIFIIVDELAKIFFHWEK